MNNLNGESMVRIATKCEVSCRRVCFNCINYNDEDRLRSKCNLTDERINWSFDTSCDKFKRINRNDLGSH